MQGHTSSESTQSPCFWITGLAGSGKTTLAESAVAFIRNDLKLKIILVDGDLIRDLIGETQSYDKESRLRVAKKISLLCKNITDQGVIVVCATISLFKEVHEWNRGNIALYHEIFVDVSLEELSRRDKKQLYSKAKSGEIKNVVGVDMAFDRPENANLVLKNNHGHLEEAKNQLNNYIKGILIRV